MKFFRINKNKLELLKKTALNSNKKRSRICVHKNTKDKIHEMFVCLHKSTYVPPHYHKNKIESYHMIEGEVDVYIFYNNGKIKNKITLSSKSKAKHFYLRIEKKVYHTLVPKTKFAIFHEVTQGPFNKRENIQNHMKIFNKKKFITN